MNRNNINFCRSRKLVQAVLTPVESKISHRVTESEYETFI